MGLGRFGARDVLRLGPFGVGMFRGWDVLRLGTFCGLGRFGVGTFCSWDILELGPFVLGRFGLGRFVLGRFVGAPHNICNNYTNMGPDHKILFQVINNHYSKGNHCYLLH